MSTTYTQSRKECTYRFKETNPDRWKEINRKAVAKYYDAHKEERKEYMKQWRRARKELKDKLLLYSNNEFSTEPDDQGIHNPKASVQVHVN